MNAERTPEITPLERIREWKAIQVHVSDWAKKLQGVKLPPEAKQPEWPSSP
jgi:hypothetical protein